MQVPLRLVLDTNVVVAGLLWSGPPRRLLEAAIEGEVQLFSSEVLLSELVQTLGYRSLAGASQALASTWTRWLRSTRRWSAWWLP